MDLAELNWTICINYLDDAIEALSEEVEHLEKALANSQELREALEDIG